MHTHHKNKYEPSKKKEKFKSKDREKFKKQGEYSKFTESLT